MGICSPYVGCIKRYDRCFTTNKKKCFCLGFFFFFFFCGGGHISYTYLHFCHGLHVNPKITKAVAGCLHNFNIMCYFAAWSLAVSFVEAYTAVVILRVNETEGISGPIYIVPTMGVMILLRMSNFLNRSYRENESSITFV